MPQISNFENSNCYISVMYMYSDFEENSYGVADWYHNILFLPKQNFKS